LPDLKDPLFAARIPTISFVSQIIAIFCAKIRCHGNKGPSEIYCNDTVKFPDLENPLFGARIPTISFVSWVTMCYITSWRQHWRHVTWMNIRLDALCS